jgi:hypothetical protein
MLAVRTLRLALLLTTLMVLLSILSTLKHASTTTIDEDPSFLAPIGMRSSNSTDIFIYSTNVSATTKLGSETNGNGNDTSFCLSTACISKEAEILARAFPDRANHTWIINDNREIDLGNYNYSSRGILYVKNFKAASSTAAGAALRIAYQHGDGKNNNQTTQPAWVRCHHARGHNYATRDPQRSFLFTSVRDPAARALSRIFYTSITRFGETPSDKNLLSKLRWNHAQFGAVSHHGGGYQVRYVSMQKDLASSWSSDNKTIVSNPHQVESTVRQIFQDYDFILVAERLDESLVAMALVMGLPIADVLVQPAKVLLGNKYLYYRSRKNKEICKRPVSAFRSPAVAAHLTSDEWYAKNYGDYLLHAAANHSLDRTIHRLGRPRVARALQEYQRLQRKAQVVCANQTISHCSDDGIPQRDLTKDNCYSDDSGCGYPCIDKMLLDEERTQ